ncbi:MerR family transcriptional regulator [Bacteroides neonati]|uniref:helix-turn-helix domain-containing protein n=1 Tax=Bacteroides neonati TaxID=1347393 RepID=UPI0004AF41AD|nr:helix-turn-helix domain-containing protein [Bacteroides neonati]
MARTKKIGKVEPVQKTVLNKQEAMAYLGVSEDYLTKLRENNEVVFHQDGRMIWYDLRSIDRFLLRNKVN